MQLPGNSRALLRDAVRRDPSHVSLLPEGERVSNLSKADLLDIADRLGIDVAAIVAQATAPGAAPVQKTQDETTDLLTAPEDEDATEDDAPAEDTTETTRKEIEAEASALRRALASAMVEGNFDAVTLSIVDLLTEARKPAVVETRIEYVAAPAGTDPSTIRTTPVPVPAPTHTATWSKLFGIGGAMANKKINIYAPTPLTPRIDDRYRWPEGVTQAALCALGRGRNAWMFGPAGTGKTSFAEQLAARTGRPFFLVSCDDTTEAPELLGMTVPHSGGVRWQDGVLTAAIRVPHAIVLIDEPTVARAGAIMVLQSVLASGILSIKETGEVVKCAEGVRFLCADNTNGTGGGTSEGYEGTRRMNRATLDRFSTFLKLDYMTPENETAALVAHTGCTPQLAELLVGCAALTRKARVTHALGLRRLIAWAEALTDGLEVRTAFEVAILNGCARDDREPTEQCCSLGLDKKQIKDAIAGITAPPVTDAPLSQAAADFT
jgi:MoxR-like ATPase